MTISVSDIKKLREKTNCSVMDCSKALNDAKGDMKKAEDFLIKEGAAKLEKKKDRETKSGIIETYCHGNKIGVMVELLCETDFVAKNETFKELAHDVAMQIAAMNPKDIKELMTQNYIKDESKTIEDMLNYTISKIGENIKINRFERIELGK